MKSIFSKWYIWLAIAAAGFYIYKRKPAGVMTDVYGAASNARNVLTSLPQIIPGTVTADVNTAAQTALQKELDAAVAPYQAGLESLTKEAGVVSPTRTQSILDYANQISAIKASILAKKI